eukprot:Colp12_sorted_trinity150504_noHs@33252
MAASEELVDIVDEYNQLLRVVKRSEMRKQNLRHRATYIFIENSEGKILVQKRTDIKDYCPGYFDACIGGVLTTGEEYEPSAYRELEEEVGLKGVNLHFLFNFLHEDSMNKVWGTAFLCKWSGDISELKLQETEVASVEWLTLDELFERHASGGKVTPDSLAAARDFKRKRSSLGIPI